ncbi:MAG TPA: hypothetical protein VFN97_01440 [Actinospica sp.]|nr:hypothetical protein [Actinospica sp.]
MNFGEMGRVIRRRWYLLLPLLIAAAAGTFAVGRAIPRQYQTTGMVSLLASQQSIKGTSTVPGTGNPFLSFDSSLNDTADFLVRRLDSNDAAQQLASRGVADYTAVLAASQGPFIQLTAQGPTPDAATGAMRTLIGYTTAQLRSLQQQQGVPGPAMITATVIVPGSPPSAQNKRRTQDALGAGAGGLALALLVTFGADSMLARRRRRPAAHAGAVAVAEPEPRFAPLEPPGGPAAELIGPRSEARD